MVIGRKNLRKKAQGQGLFATYIKWNGRTDLEHIEHNGLKHDAIYRVISANVSHTELTLQEISTGIILPDMYSSELFAPLHSRLGYAYAMPKVGESFIMILVNPVHQKKKGAKFPTKWATQDDWKTTPVQAFEQVGDDTWNVITMNSVYSVQIVIR